VKLLAYRVFDRTKAPQSGKNESPRDHELRVAKRAHELYEQRRDGSAEKDWQRAERETRAH
jgi:hypothetical protein